MNALAPIRGPNQFAQQNLQAQNHALPAQQIIYQVVQCGCTANTPCLQHIPAPKPGPVVRCVKFLACWECGPIGTIIAAFSFAIGTVISYYTIKLAIWTANKDYIEHCQADEVCLHYSIHMWVGCVRANSFKGGSTSEGPM